LDNIYIYIAAIPSPLSLTRKQNKGENKKKHDIFKSNETVLESVFSFQRLKKIFESLWESTWN